MLHSPFWHGTHGRGYEPTGSGEAVVGAGVAGAAVVTNCDTSHPVLTLCDKQIDAVQIHVVKFAPQRGVKIREQFFPVPVSLGSHPRPV